MDSRHPVYIQVQLLDDKKRKDCLHNLTDNGTMKDGFALDIRPTEHKDVHKHMDWYTVRLCKHDRLDSPSSNDSRLPNNDRMDCLGIHSDSDILLVYQLHNIQHWVHKDHWLHMD